MSEQSVAEAPPQAVQHRQGGQPAAPRLRLGRVILVLVLAVLGVVVLVHAAGPGTAILIGLAAVAVLLLWLLYKFLPRMRRTARRTRRAMSPPGRAVPGSRSGGTTRRTARNRRGASGGAASPGRGASARRRLARFGRGRASGGSGAPRRGGSSGPGRTGSRFSPRGRSARRGVSLVKGGGSRPGLGARLRHPIRSRGRGGLGGGSSPRRGFGRLLGGKGSAGRRPGGSNTGRRGVGTTGPRPNGTSTRPPPRSAIGRGVRRALGILSPRMRGRLRGRSAGQPPAAPLQPQRQPKRRIRRAFGRWWNGQPVFPRRRRKLRPQVSTGTNGTHGAPYSVSVKPTPLPPAAATPPPRPGLKLVASNGRRVNGKARGMSTGNLEAVTEAVDQQIAGFHPENRNQVDAFFAGLADMHRNIGKALQRAADNCEDEHIHKAVIEALREHGQVESGVGDHAERSYQAHLAQHRVWLEDN